MSSFIGRGLEATRKRQYVRLPTYKFLVETRYLRAPYSRRHAGTTAQRYSDSPNSGGSSHCKMSTDDMPGIEQENRRSTRVGSESTNGIVVLALIAAALLLWWLCRWHPSILPFWAPWEFSWVQFLTIWLTAWWYLRGVAVTPAAERPSIAQILFFLVGLSVVYAMVQTRFEYVAEHMFFLNRIQHIGMHHVGPLLIALSWPGASLKRGIPLRLQHLVDHPFTRKSVNIIQQPLLAALLFVGLIAFWLIPIVHFRAMINPSLYAVMNWSMVVDGILFWCLVLDPRPKPPARTSVATRATLAAIVMFPQILIGAIIALDSHDLYPFYGLCGRIYPAIEAGTDQVIGGLIIWIPAAMMSVLASILVINALRRFEETKKGDGYGDDTSALAIPASLWTGR
jgi:putative membrane protein